jgi:hypothetical protein
MPELRPAVAAARAVFTRVDAQAYLDRLDKAEREGRSVTAGQGAEVAAQA